MLVAVPTHRVLAGVPATVTTPILDQNGALNVSASGVTVEVTKLNGTNVVTAGTAATVTAGVASTSLTAAQTAQTDVLTIKWTMSGQLVATSTVRIVSAYYASVAEIRSSDPSIESNPEKYSDRKIIAVRNDAETLFEHITGRSFVPAYRIDRIAGSARDRLVLPTWDLRKLRSVKVFQTGTTFTSWTQAELDSVPSSAAGVAIRTDGYVWAGSYPSVLAGLGTVGTITNDAENLNLLIEWEHGLDALPADLKVAFLRWVRHQLNASMSGIPDRATAIVDGPGGGSFRISTPGMSGAITGLPEVDEALKRYRRARLTIA